ncbi:hypothetical protein TanjilG_10426 [Lupinus angustifolius]|uniref:Core Histone H2A/H2B/H3 domain-containing protein n=1 Tax=Lupinus angustifolius TaxID=3871 RepID=A0A4P1R524_LUPAN|nr:hypothetical protein TanjilG_10426 [Lupinus angustifolius]
MIELMEGSSINKRKKMKQHQQTYNKYIFKVPKQTHHDLGISSKAMEIMNNFINYMFNKLALESSQLALEKNPYQCNQSNFDVSTILTQASKSILSPHKKTKKTRFEYGEDVEYIELKKGSSINKRKKMKQHQQTYNKYIFKVLKQSHHDLGISSKDMEKMNNFINDMFDKLAHESSPLALYYKKTSITDRDIQTAVRLVLPDELAKNVVFEGAKAVTNFTIM